MKMRYLVLVVLLVLGCQGMSARIGNNKEFWLITQAEYNKMIYLDKDVVSKRYIVLPSIDKKYRDLFKTQDEEALLAKFSYLLVKNHQEWMNRYVETCDTTLEVNGLIKGLYYLSKEHYLLAMKYFEKMDGEKHCFLRLVLIADCRFELMQDRNERKSVIAAYQRAMDVASDRQERDFVQNRMKYIRYN